jgi:hypothetical protein
MVNLCLRIRHSLPKSKHGNRLLWFVSFSKPLLHPHHVLLNLNLFCHIIYINTFLFPHQIHQHKGKGGFGLVRLLETQETKWVSVALPAAKFYKGQTPIEKYSKKMNIEKGAKKLIELGRGICRLPTKRQPKAGL